MNVYLAVTLIPN